MAAKRNADKPEQPTLPVAELPTAEATEEPTLETPEVAEETKPEPAPDDSGADAPLVEPMVAPEEPASVIPPDAMVVVRLTGATTAMLGGQAMFRGDARTVSYATLQEALAHHAGKFSVKYPGSEKFVTA